MDAFYMAFKAAELGLEKGGNREKALFRMGQAKYGMREWQKASDYFLEVLNEFPDNVSASAQLHRVKDRLAEQNHGKYNFKQMFIDSKKEKPDLDVGNYKGSIQIADIPGKGRGIIATKDIKEGTLLVVSKPFASGYKQDFPKNLMSVMPGNPTFPQHILQFINAMQNLQNNPEQAKEVYKLYAGDNIAEYEEIPFGVIDAKRIQQIRVGFSNAFRSFFGDIIAIHASEDFKKGEEIYLPYLYPLNGYLERKNTIMARGFICQCKLCELDANDPNCLIRDQMLKKLKGFKEDYSPNFVVANGEPILKKIRQSYANRNELKVVLAQALVILASAYFNTGNSSKAITYLEEAVALMNNPLKYSMRIADICVNIGTCYLSSGNRKKFNDIIEKAMALSFCSNDKEYFKMLYPEIVDYL
uniref:SET domain-containing protein n=1 Tax=Panagrolaimus davidi TaxID=227884 RepID=A0A914QK97_9BILA